MSHLICLQQHHHHFPPQSLPQIHLVCLPAYRHGYLRVSLQKRLQQYRRIYQHGILHLCPQVHLRGSLQISQRKHRQACLLMCLQAHPPFNRRQYLRVYHPFFRRPCHQTYRRPLLLGSLLASHRLRHHLCRLLFPQANHRLCPRIFLRHCHQ